MEPLKILFAIFWAGGITLLTIPSIIDFAHSKKLLDVPNERKSHKLLTPRLGGVAIFAGLLSGIAIFGSFNTEIQILIGGLVLLFFAGIRDDLSSITVGKKFSIQIIVAILMVLLADVRISSMHGLFGVYDIPYALSIIISLIFIIGIVNSINLIDGIDGLAGIIIVVISVAYGILLWPIDPAMSLVSFILAGSLVGFLPFNIYKAKVFMGDTGATISGLVIAYISIKFIESSFVSRPALALAILMIPIYDTLRVMIIRVINKKPLFQADKNHIHHKLIKAGLNSVKVGLLLGSINIIVIIGVNFYKHLGSSIIILTLLSIALIFEIILQITVARKIHADKKAF